MKRILIGGANSYIGTSFEKFMNQFSNEYIIDTIDMKQKNWVEHDFSSYDCIIQIAAIVHVKELNEELYFKINRDLAVEVAKKAKQGGVRQFIYLSSMSVFGKNEGVISKDTIPTPTTAYGKSKLAAEKKLMKMNDVAFKVAVLRPPMIYGKNSIGNYSRLSSLANELPFFPKLSNKRSMLYVDNLNAFCKLLIDNQLDGIFHPQNENYVNTSDLVKTIREVHGKRTIMIPGFNSLISLFQKKVTLLQKVFGTLIYAESMSGYPNSKYKGIEMNYQYYDFEESIKITEL